MPGYNCTTVDLGTFFIDNYFALTKAYWSQTKRAESVSSKSSRSTSLSMPNVHAWIQVVLLRACPYHALV